MRFWLLLGAGFLGVWASSASEAVAPFEPGFAGCFEYFESAAECDGDTSLGGHPDLRLRFCVGHDPSCVSDDAPVTDSIFDTVAMSIPSAFGVPAFGDAPVGALTGRLTAEVTLGILNGACDDHIQVVLNLLQASVDVEDIISDQNPLTNLFFDTDGNDVPDGADRYPEFLTDVLGDNQPRARFFGITPVLGFLVAVNLVVLEPGTTIPSHGGTLRFESAMGYPVVFVLSNPTGISPFPASVTDFCAPFEMDLTMFGRTIDNPCSGSPSGFANCPGGPIVSNRGYPFLPCETANANDEDDDGAVNDGCPQSNSDPESDIPGACSNTVSDDSEDTDINDGCPTVGALSEGERMPGACGGVDEGGCALLTNPNVAGVHAPYLYSNGLPDADGDGIENKLDVCALIPNGDWDPRAATVPSDPDNDGLPDECDPDPPSPGEGSPQTCPAGFTGSDEDLDCRPNRLDNCPVDPNLNQSDVDRDQIGDVCDPDPVARNGEIPEACRRLSLIVGVAGGGLTTGEMAPVENCASLAVSAPQPDPDGDGICTPFVPPGDSGCSGEDNCPSVANEGQADADDDGIGDACENQVPGAVGGRAGLVSNDGRRGGGAWPVREIGLAMMLVLGAYALKNLRRAR